MAQKIKMVKDGVEVEVEVAQVFETQTDFDKALKSEKSKGQGEILQAIGVASVEEAKTKMGAQTKVEEQERRIAALEKENKQTQRQLYANELGIKPELVNKVIILAEASASEGKDFREVMKAEAEAIGALKGNDPNQTNPTAPKQMGVSKTKEQVAEDKAWDEEQKRLQGLDPQSR